MTPRAWLTWTVGKTGGERRPAAARNRGLGRRRASQNRDVTPWAWLTKTYGRVQAIPPQSGVTASNNNSDSKWLENFDVRLSGGKGVDFSRGTS